MGFNRENFLSALAGGLIAVMLVAVLPAGAENGDSLVVGTKNTAASRTKLTTRGGVVLRTGNPGKPVLYLDVLPGSPPMAVNSDAKVNNLNADLLDGISSGEFVRGLVIQEATLTGSLGADSTTATTKECADTAIPIGAGYSITEGDVEIVSSYPLAGTDDWQIGLWNPAAGTVDYTIVMYLICVWVQV